MPKSAAHAEDPLPSQEDALRVNRAYVELQTSKYYMYGLAAAGLLAVMIALKSLFTLLGISKSTADSTLVDFLELILVAVLFFEIGFIAKVAQVDSFENIKHKQFGSDCLLGFVSLVCFLLDNLVRARVVNSILELIWTAPYTIRAVRGVLVSAQAVKEAATTEAAAGSSFTVPKISKGAVATAVLGRLAKF